MDVKKFLKEAGLLSPVSSALLSIPSAADRADDAYHKAMKKIHEGEQSMKTASGGMGGALAGLFGAGGNPLATIAMLLGEQAAGPLIGLPAQMIAHKAMQPSLGDSFKNEFVKTTGKELASGAVGLLGKGLGAAAHAAGGIGDGSARNTIIAQLKKEDPVIARADTKLLMEAFDTMVQFAPTLSKDKNAVRSYLREAVLTGSGPNYATIKMLADAERAVTGGGTK